MKILVCDDISSAGTDLFRQNGFEVNEAGSLKPEQLAKIIDQYDGLIVRSATKVPDTVLNSTNRLRVIGRAGTGVDNIDTRAATRRGIVVMNAAQGNTITTAEHTIAMLMSVARLIPQATLSLKNGKWEKNKFVGAEVNSKTLGIIGVGKIGAVVASRAMGLGMRVIAFDPYLSNEAAAKIGIEPVSLDDLYARSDFITIHTPMTAETKGMVNRDAFAKMRDGVRVINCARGGLIDEEDLLAALNTGKVAGAALDVFEQEPPPANHPLVIHERVICTPHLGASTEEAQVGVAVTVAEQIIDFLLNQTVRGPVNVPALNSEQLRLIRPYLSLAESIGDFFGQAFGHSISEITVEYSGDVADLDTTTVTQAVLVGLFSSVIERLNFVNATLILQERGVKLIETLDHRARDFASAITIKAQTPEGEREVSGALFDGNNPRLVRINGFNLEAIPKGDMLVVLNHDVPGVIGNIATFLGNQGINIGRFHLGRKEIGGIAISIIQIDASLITSQLSEIGHLPNVISVKQVRLP
ncbi:MAG TPA: phosphoglycerate dehydrogenase [Blastocatellia bacterium]|nr:phosphoglycerate dehydrogenase [Blastocatellia bacterium]